MKRSVAPWAPCLTGEILTGARTRHWPACPVPGTTRWNTGQRSAVARFTIRSTLLNLRLPHRFNGRQGIPSCRPLPHAHSAVSTVQRGLEHRDHVGENSVGVTILL